MADPRIEEVVHIEMNRMRGRLAGFMESCGLPERQERSMVTLMKSLSYDAEAHIIEQLDQQ